MLKRFVRFFGGDPNQREIDRFSGIVDQVNSLETEYEQLSADALAGKTVEFRTRLADGETLDDLLPEAFAAVREASKRTIGLRHYDVQLIGGAVLHHSRIAEMRTGEGKTLVATLPIYLNALTGRGVHLITVNDYLARRDARWMAPIYMTLGLSVGVLQMAARTENGKKAFLVDLEKTSPHEDQHQLRMAPRAEAYAADITYGTNSEFGFDYLRDNMTMRMEDRVQRGHYYAIVDEVDNVLIDEARTPLIISGPAQDEAEWYIRMAQVVKQLRQEDVEISEKDKTVTLTDVGETRVEELLGVALRDPDRPEDLTHEQERLLGYLEQALRAQYLFRRNKDYLVQAKQVVIIDEFTGRLMPGRRWSDGLHQAVEAKEGVKVQSESVTYATITIQNYFRMYEKLAGMTGTALTEAEEFDKIYKLGVVAIPTNLEFQATRSEAGLVELEDKDDQGYKYKYYIRKGDAQRTPVYWRRKDYPDTVYRTEEMKLRAIVREILHYHVLGRPMLVGTTSVELSERLSNRLSREPLRRLAQVMLLRDAWFKVNQREEDGRQCPELQYLNGPLDDLDVPEMRKMGRDLGLSFTPDEPANIEQLLTLLDLGPEDKDRLVTDLQAGIPHQVLNARKHTEESQIIAGAGAFGAVTIATNMAGRGVDIKLGGELAEEIISGVNRVLKRAGHADPYDMQMEERRKALLALAPEEYGIYDAEVKFFLNHMEDMGRVRRLGGLHVIGSERHEARRIDNQLRGRSARQGDPGSSRFYLSMQDELMRLFGGQQAEGLMQRLKIDDYLPIEYGMVGRIVESSQGRVEGANFDVRKHLLEYDDVLNTQRTKIYDQRNRIFSKDDLSEDVTEMLQTEISQRVPEALADEDGPWKLLSWLEQVQPPLNMMGRIFPTYAFHLLVDHLLADGKKSSLSRSEARQALLDTVEACLQAEQDHLLKVVNEQLNLAADRLDQQITERHDTLDTFLEGLRDNDETDTRRPQDIFNDLSAELHLPLRLSVEQMRLLRSDPDEVIADLREQVESALVIQVVTRLIGSVERRLEESLELNSSQLSLGDWNAVASQVLDAAEAVFARRHERYLGPTGQITKDLDAALARLPAEVASPELIWLLTLLPQGARSTFDKKTHRRVYQRTYRLTYVYYTARFLENQPASKIADDVLEHLENAQAAVRRAWGLAEYTRLANVTMASLDEKAQRGLRLALGEDHYAQLSAQPIGSVVDLDGGTVVDELGRLALTEIYRQLLLGVITDLWVDYLTRMEALRISIGLEAYAQRDPLVQYKNRAFELFQTLLGDMRLGVITRMFTYRPRDINSVQAAPGQAGARPGAEPAEADEQDGAGPSDGGGTLALQAVAGDDGSKLEVQVSANSEDGEAAAKKRRRRRR